MDGGQKELLAEKSRAIRLYPHLVIQQLVTSPSIPAPSLVAWFYAAGDFLYEFA